MSIHCDYLLDAGDEYTSFEDYYPLYIEDINGTNKIRLFENNSPTFSKYFISQDQELLIFQSKDIYKFNLTSKQNEFQFRLPLGNPRYQILSNNKSFIVFVANDVDTCIELYKINIDGSNLQRLTFTPYDYEHNLSISKDDTKLVFTTASNKTNVGQTISMLDMTTGEITQIMYHYDTHPVVNYKYFFSSPLIIHDNSEILFFKDCEIENMLTDSLFLYNLNTQTKQLIDPDASRLYPLVTSDVENLFLYCRYKGGEHLMLFDSQANTLTEVGEINSYAGYTISPDEHIILCWNKGGYADRTIYKIGTDELKWTRFETGTDAIFSSDGKRILFSGYEQKKY